MPLLCKYLSSDYVFKFIPSVMKAFRKKVVAQNFINLGGYLRIICTLLLGQLSLL